MKRISLYLAGLLVSLGTIWAFQRGAGDFSVFFSAWKLAWQGQGTLIYHRTPDRFLYAPGFAWLGAPLALLPERLVLLFWCILKASALGWIIRRFSVFGYGVAAAGLVFCARPLLIDFQYGQINILILAAVLGALFNFLDSRRGESTPAADFWSWFWLGAAAITKIFPLPLLALPIFRGNSRQRSGAATGAALLLILPLVFVGGHAAGQLMQDWQTALLERGLPMESHNQSFIAVLRHFLSGVPTHVVALSAERLYSVGAWPANLLTLIGLAWTVIWLGIFLAWLLRREPSYLWVALCTGLLILPSHLIWKPYFVFSIPLAIVALSAAKRTPQKIWLGFLFCVLNLTGFDFLGYELASRLEAAGVFLFSHLGLVVSLMAN